MLSKERLMTALHKEKPDRLPVTFHYWLDYHLKLYLDGISMLQAFQKFGMDAQIPYLGDLGQSILGDCDSVTSYTSEWRNEVTLVSSDSDNRIAHHAIHTPGGVLTYKTRSDGKTTWITEYMIKRDEEIELIDKFMPVAKLNLELARKLYDEVGDKGILRGIVWGEQPGCWAHACCLMDVTDLILRCNDKPDWVHRLLTILLNKKLRFIESMKGAKFDLVENGGGVGGTTVISPQLHKEFCLPYDRKINDALHDLGFMVTYHTCGGTRGIEELLIANGTDVSETLAPPSIGGNQEPWEFKRKVGRRLALIGGLDQFNVLTAGPKGRIQTEVHKLFEKVGYEGGYVCSGCDHFFDAPLENIQAMADAARECVYN
jgi:hypothetical protein